MHGDDSLDGSPLAGKFPDRVDQLSGIVGIVNDGKIAENVGGSRFGKLLGNAQQVDAVELSDSLRAAQTLSLLREELQTQPCAGCRIATGSLSDSLAGGQAPRVELRLTGRFVVQHVLNQVAVARQDVLFRERLDTMKRPVRTLESQQRIWLVGGRLHPDEVLEWIVGAVRTGEPGFLRPVKGSSQMLMVVIRRQVDQ